MKDTILERRFRKGAEMEKHEVQTSSQVYARIGDVLYLITIVVGIFILPLASDQGRFANIRINHSCLERSAMEAASERQR